ncbi:hypothetical protein FRX31_023580, partial [Thalictrum thalictroides]
VINHRICGSCKGGWLVTVHEDREIQEKNKNCLYYAIGVRTSEGCTIVVKVIMSCSHVKKAIVMVLQGFPKKLAFCRIGKDTKWNIVNGDDNARLVDVTFYQGKFYTVRNSGKLLLVARSRYEPEVDYDLLEEDYLISYERKSFTVYKLNFNAPKWVKVSYLGKYCPLFVGFNQSFSFKTSDFPGCKGNCVYFSDDYVDHCYEEPVGVYNLGHRIVQKCYPK